MSQILTLVQFHTENYTRFLEERYILNLKGLYGDRSVDKMWALSVRTICSQRCYLLSVLNVKA